MTHFNLAERLEHLQNLKGNFTYSPTYFDLVKGIANVISWYYSPSMWKNYNFPQSFIDEFTQYYYFPIHQALYIVYIAIFITILRYVFEKTVCKLFVDWLDLKASNKKKFPESAWKCLFYTCTWTYNVYLLNFRYDYFRKPYLIWDDWSAGMSVPLDIQIMYFIQCGFYLHSIYGTLYMDNKRKDYYAMLLHHVITMTLIFVSYATRYHKIGLLVLFVHDITDIWLELAKALHYLSSRKDREYPFYETLANASSVMFVLCWFLFRVYWYPLKVLYSTGVVTAYRAYDKGCGLYLFFNSLLWLLLGLNIYWLYFILQFLARTLAGANKGLQDTREDFDDDEETTTTTTSNSVKASVNKKEQ